MDLPLASRLAALHDRHGRLLALELTAVVDELQSRCPGACSDPVFAAAWDRFAALRGSKVRHALEEPAVEAWIRRAQALIGSPVLRTCPTHHVPRLLARFSALMVNLASLEEGTAEGTAVVSGSGSVPILLGAAQLRPPTARRTVVHWSWNSSLHLRDEDGQTLLEIGEDGHPASGPGRGWTLDIAQPLNGIRVFAEPRCVQHSGALSAPGFPAAFAQAHEALPAATRRLLHLSTRAAGPDCALHPVDALSWLGTSARRSAEELAHGLAANFVGRCARVYRFDASSRLTDALGAEEQQDLVQTLSRELLTDEAHAPESMLGRLLAVCELRQPAPVSATASPEPGVLLDLRPVLTRAGIHAAEPDLWIEPKHRRRDRAPGWRVLDALLSFSPAETARLRAALSEWPEPEIRHFGLACVDYFEGRFAAGAAHVLACVEADRACEDYWLLLALHARHLRHFDVFDDVVFGQARSDALLERVRRSV